MNDFFNPKTGAFTANIRATNDGDDTELRESLKQFGWSSEFPALKDEHGVVLVGHRRLKIADELGIAPVVKTYTFGSGTAADAERLKLALVSNIGFKAMTKEDRQRIAEHLYGERQWTMEKIGKALNVSHQTIGRDLGNLSTMDKSKPAKTASNPKGAGRPKGSSKPSTPAKAHTAAPSPKVTTAPSTPPRAPQAPPRTRANGASKTPVLDRARDIVRPLIWNDEPHNPRKLEDQHDISHVHFETAIAVERALKDEPPIDPSTLSKTAQEKLAVMVKHERRKLEIEIKQQLHAYYQKWLADLLTDYRKKEQHYNIIISQHRGALTSAEYNLIWSCLHPDSRKSTSDEKLAKAFHLFTKLEKLMIEVKDPVAKYGNLPTSAELDKRRAEFDAKRAAERSAKRGNGAAMARR